MQQFLGIKFPTIKIMLAFWDLIKFLAQCTVIINENGYIFLFKGILTKLQLSKENDLRTARVSDISILRFVCEIFSIIETVTENAS